MTNKERLAIAEEVLPKVRGVKLCDMEILHCYSANPPDTIFSAWANNVKLVESRDIIDCIHFARQKLAAEREAKKSPREKRLESIVKRLDREDTATVFITRREALEALKEDV